MKHLILISFLCVLFLSAPFAAAESESPTISAMKTELLRSYEALKKADPPAYFIAYRLYDQEEADVTADRGSVITVTPYERNRYASVEVRVGDYDFDSSHHLVNDDRADVENTLGAFGMIPFDDGKVLRSTLWLETEKEYRSAAQRYGKVVAQRGLKSEEDVCPDLSREKPHSRVDATGWDQKLDVEPFSAAAKSLSKLFSQYPDIEQSWTHFKVNRVNRYLVNTEGTAVTDKSMRIAFSTGASSTATDGEKISRSEVFYFTNPADLEKLRPKFEHLVREVATSVVALRKSPLADPYCGPVVLKGPAAAVLFHEVLGHRLEASRHRNSTDGKTFAKMLGEKILPPFLSVYDNPSVRILNDIELNGHYSVDDDGVPAQDVTLIKNGKLESFLMGRAPIPTCGKSNGHGRCGSASSYDPVSRMANLIVESSKTTSEEVLRQHLLDEVKKQGKPYGLMIEEVRGGETNTSSYQAQMFQIQPSLVRRVYADGRPDDLIRGVRVIGTPMSALQHIIETADKVEVMNGYCGAESGWVAQANCCPSVLVDSIEIERETPDKGIARVLPPPTGAPKGPDVVLQAMSDELERSLQQLRIDKKSNPYYVGYRSTDGERIRIAYELGKKAEDEIHLDRAMQVDMHVGDHKFDNTAALTGRPNRDASRYVALDDNYDSIRRNVWVLTDDAYKTASEDLEKQEAYRHGHNIRNLCESFCKTNPTVSIAPEPPALTLQQDWNERLRKVSQVFENYPQIRKSWVVMEADRQVFRIANTEGTRIRMPWMPIIIGITAFARCPDGEDIWDCDYVRVLNENDVPTQEQLEAKAKALAENLTAYTQSERKNYYFGPILFEPQASGEVLEHGIAPKLCAIAGDNLHPSGTLLRCIDTRILPKFLSITDDPTCTSYQGEAIAGPYDFDDEGTPSSKVQLVDHGFLKELLTSRTPVLSGQKSNGHNFGDQILPTTLIMQSDKPSTAKTLEMQLLRLAREQGLKEAIIVKRIVPQTAKLMHGDTETARGDSLDRCTPLEVYSIDVATGERKRVRGLRFHGFGLGTMQGIVAAGNEPKNFNTVAWNGSIRSVIAPSLLINHMELEEDGRDTVSAYPLQNPFFAEK